METFIQKVRKRLMLPWVLIFAFIGIGLQVNAQSDCSNPIIICGNTDSYFPNGLGSNLEQLACGNVEHNSVWLAFQAKASGKLNFVIRLYNPSGLPTNSDFDWSIFKLNGPPGTNSCNQKIDMSCSYAGSSTSYGIPGATGLSTPNTGIGAFNPGIDVVMGQWYILLVDQFSNSTPLKFSVQFTNNPESNSINSTPAIFDNRPNFGVDADSSCSGVFRFYDSSFAAAGISSYLWDFGDGTTSTQKDPRKEFVSNGTYFVKLTVTDNNGCKTSIVKRVVYNPSALALNIAGFQIMPSCLGSANGSIRINPTGHSTAAVSGGVPPYRYELISPSPVTRTIQTSNIFSNLPAGVYSVKVWDNCGISVVISATVPSEAISTTPSVSVSGTTIIPSCAGGSTGEALLTVSNGVPPFSCSLVSPSPILVSNVNAELYNVVSTSYYAKFSNLPPGQYSFLVTDACNRTTQGVFTVPVSSSPSIGATTTASCSDKPTGKIAVRLSLNGINNGAAFGSLQVALISPSPEIRGFQSSNVFENLYPGTYTYAIRDTCGSISTATATVSAASAPSFGSTFAIASCPNSGTGSLKTQVTSTGGGGPYLFELLPPSPLVRPAQASNFFDSLVPGNYTIRLTDGCGISKVDTVSVRAANAPTFTASSSASCVSQGNGSILIQPNSSALSPFQFELISPGAAIRPTQYSNIANSVNARFADLNIGKYTVKMTDACGVDVTDTISVPGSTNFSFPSGVTTLPSCSTSATGWLAVQAPTTGIAPYTFELIAPSPEIRPAQTSRIFSNLPVGDYTIRITDACGNTVTNSSPFTLAAATAPTAPTITNSSSCSTSSTGSIVISLTANSGGGAPYQFALVSPSPVTRAFQNNPVFTGLPVGTYTVQTKDQCGLTVDAQTTIAAALPFSASASTAIVGCSASTYLSQVTVVPQSFNGYGPIPSGSGGGPYTYAIYNSTNTTVIFPAQSTNVFPAVPHLTGSPTHVVRVTDVCNNTATVNISLNSTGPDVGSLAIVSSSCASKANGSIRVATVPPGGRLPYQYSLINSTNSSVVIGPQYSTLFDSVPVNASGYLLRITDACGKTSTTATPLAFPASVVPSVTGTPTPSCSGSATGSILTTITTGTTQAGGTFQYALLNSSNSAVVRPNQSHPYFGNLPAGSYLIRITDNCNATSNSPAVVVSSIPPALTAAGVASVTCGSGGSGTVTASSQGGIAPIRYSLINNATSAVVAGPQLNNVFSGLAAGTYTVRALDSCGTIANSSNVVVSVTTQNPTITTTSAIDCGGFAKIAGFGAGGNGGPYTYALCSGANCSTFSSFSTNSIFTVTNSGTYRIAVKDKCGNQTISGDIVINIPVRAVLNSITKANACGSTAITVNYSNVPNTPHYSVNGSNFSPTIPILNPGTYLIRVTDFNNGTYGCSSDTGTVVVTSGLTPAITVTASPSTACPGSSITYTATSTNGGSTPAYQWKLNGVNVGSNSATYVKSNSSNLDTIVCVLTSSGSCVSSPTATSTPLVANYYPVIANNQITGNQSISSGSVPTQFTGTAATGGGGTLSYKWISSTTSASSGFVAASGVNNTANYSSPALTQTTYFRRVVSGSSCGVDTSSAITVSITGSPNISASASLTSFTACSGTASGQQSFTVSGSSLTSNISVTPPAGYEVSLTSGSGFSSTLNITPTSGTVAAATVYIRMSSVATGTPSGNIALGSTGATTQNVPVSGTVNALPTITLGSVSSVLTNATSFSLPYSATTGTPNQYSVTAGSPTAMSGFTAVSNASLGSSPIGITIPASAANTYNFNLTVRNSTTGCVSANVPFTLTVNAPGGILNNTISTAQTICSGSTPAALSGSTPTGGTGNFTYTWLRSTTSATTGFTSATGTNSNINYNPPALTQNTWFRRFVVSGSVSDTSAAVLITVTNPISNNTIANPIANAVCLGDFTPDMDGSTPSGGDGTTYSYQWLKSTTSASAGFTAISGANAKSYFPPVLSQTTWFRRIVSSGQCAADTSAAKGITVNPIPTITLGTISSVNTLATSFSIPYSATTGTPTQYSIATGSPTAMPGFTLVSNASLGTSPISVSIPASAANTYNFNFTVRNTSTGCVSAVVPIALTVTPGSLPIGNNTIGSAQTICSGTAPAQLTGSTPTGGNETFTYTWLKSTTNAVNGFTAIPSSNTVNYTSPALTQTTWFRRYVVSGAHSDTSAAIKITVGDTIRPVVVARNLTVYLNASGNASITAAQADSASADNCGIQSRALSTSSFTCANLGSNTVRLLVTDLAGNKDSANFTVLVMDTVKPVVITQNRTVYLNASGNASLTASQINNGSSDACGIASVSLNTTSFTCSNVGPNTVTLTVTDVNGNVQTGTATVTVLDTIKPTVNVQSGLVLYLNANGTASVASSMINNGSTDNCGIASVTISPTTINCAHLGITPVTLTVTDVNGNSASGVSNVVVLDPVAPVARPKARLNLYLSGNGQAVINPALLDSASSDNCTLTSRVLSQSVFNCSNIGTNNVTFTVQDQSGNSHAAIVQVTVIDTIAPVATVSNQLVYLNNAGTATITAAMVNNNSTDNCGIQSVSISKSTFTCSDLGTSTINFTVTDVNGNFKTAPVVINVFDTIRPVMRPKKNVLVYLNALGTANLSLSAVDSASSDNCNLATRTLSKTQFGCADLGVNTLTLTGTDSTGNIGSAQFSLTVLDTIRPVLNTRSATLYVDGSGNAVLNPSDVILSGTDNCSAAPLAGLSKNNFNCSNLGGNTVSVTLTDASGNFRTASASVTVLDTIKPTAIGQNRTIYLNASGTASITAAQVNNGSTDNCSVQSLSISKTNFTAADLGANLVTLTVTDQSSNSAQTQVLITVLDTIKPIVTTQNRTIYLNASGVATIAASQINNGSTDNVSISAVQLSKTLFTCSDLGNNQVVLTVIDGSNNSQTGTATVTVVDTIKPIVNTQNITLYLNGIGQATLTPAQANNGSSDNCGVSNLNLSKTLFTCADRGNNTIQLQVTDASNNSSSGSLQVTVLDTIRPNVVVNNNLTLYLNNAGIATLTNAMVGNGSTDNCGITSQTLSKTSFNGTNLGLNLVNYTIADASGNTNSVILNITVVDTIRPVVSVQNRTIYLDGSGTATLTPAMVNNGSSDNVGITLQQLSKTSFNCNNLGANQVLYTLEDASANQMSALVTITVLDTIKPTASARNLTVYLNSAGTASITPAQANNGSSDNCSTASLALSKSEFGCADLGPNAVVLTVNDGSNNASTASFTVTVLDTIRPSLLVNPMVMLYLDSNGQASLSTDQVNLSSFDNCSALSFSLSKTSFNGLNLGMNQVIFTATDGSNNVRTANISVNVIDTVRPRIRAKNLTLHLGNGGFVFLSPAEVDNGSTDNVGVSFSALSKTIFNCNETGTNLVEYFIQDISGNRSSSWVTVTVLDTMMPVVTSFPESVILGHCNTDFQFSIPTATDNCSQVTIKQTTGIGNGKKYPVGVTTNTFTFTDRSGNLVTRSFTVTILPPYLPDTFPNITVCSSNPPFDLTRGNANVVFSGSGVSLDGKQFDPGLSGPGNHAVVCTFTDSMGCETKANFFVTVHRSPDKPMIERMNSDVLQVTQSFDFYQWRRNYEDIPGANQRAYTMTKTGIYSVRVGTVQGCTTESDPVGVGVALGIGSLEDGLSFNLFPNPTQERFRVDVNNLRGNEGFEVQVFDGVGRLVYSAQESAFSHSVETGDWSPGTYFVHIKSGDEKAIKPVIIAK
ncbi:MAG: HYR domain-containing protein [Bacteroidia bacterium]|nr:HYR domain-containing protein [Bacteroidia bacterium]